jgi:hypothetical protein
MPETTPDTAKIFKSLAMSFAVAEKPAEVEETQTASDHSKTAARVDSACQAG